MPAFLKNFEYETMVLLVDFLKILLPAGLVLYAMYLTMKGFLNKELEKKVLDYKMKNSEVILPIRLQAYERMALFLERIAPNNLIVRLNDSSYSAKQLQHVLLSEIREEFGHNLSQQVYMSDQSWTLIKKAMEDVIININKSAQDLPEDAKGLELAKRIFENILAGEKESISEALTYMKNEIRQVF